MMKLCSVPDCGQRYYANGLCNKHNLRMRHHGSIDLLYPPNRKCEAPGCERGGKLRKGLCDIHRQRMRATGTLLSRVMRGVSAVERILSKCIRSDDGCLVYTGRLTKKGYAHVKADNGKMRFAHVIMYEHHVGSVPAGLELDHLCRNRACVESTHLDPVTHEVNMERSFAARRGEWSWPAIRCDEVSQ